MRSLSLLTGSLVAVSAFVTAPAQAAMIPNGTLSISILVPPTVSLGTVNSYTDTGATYLSGGTGSFTPLGGALNGALAGTIDFSSATGISSAISLPNFFTFDDGSGGTYSFSATSVETLNYSVNPGVSTAISLYLLGTTLDSALGYTATPTSLTLSLNSTGGSLFSSSATLAIPPAGVASVPEPATWAFTVMGFGAMGAMLRRPRKSNVSLSFA
jgi:hypothetical protein